MEQNSGKICSMCGKKFDMWDEQEDFCFVRHIGYGSKYDMMGLYLNLCCDCFDKSASILWACRRERRWRFGMRRNIRRSNAFYA